MTKLEIIAALEERIRDNCKAVDVDRAYDDMLDECSSECEMCERYGAARILKEVDPTAYHCGKVNYEDSLGLIEVDGEYYEHDAAEKARDELVDEWETEVLDLEDELESDADDLEAEDVAKNEARIAELNEAVKVAKAHAL